MIKENSFFSTFASFRSSVIKKSGVKEINLFSTLRFRSGKRTPDFQKFLSFFFLFFFAILSFNLIISSNFNFSFLKKFVKSRERDSNPRLYPSPSKPRRGLEPPTYCLQNSCSTIELPRHRRWGATLPASQNCCSTTELSRLNRKSIATFSWIFLFSANNYHLLQISFSELFLLIFEANLKFCYLFLRSKF